MKIDNELIDRLGRLVKLEFDEDSRTQLRSDLERILDMVDKLNELDTEQVEPLKYLSVGHDFLREDVVDRTYVKEQALRNAPQADSDYIKVPKVIKK